MMWPVSAPDAIKLQQRHLGSDSVCVRGQATCRSASVADTRAHPMFKLRLAACLFLLGLFCSVRGV